MTNNDILLRLRYALNFSNSRIAKIIALVNEEIAPSQVELWLKKEGAAALSDTELCQFLDGLIIEKRGPRPDGTTPAPLERLSNNEILKKLRIALNLREEGMLAVFKDADFAVSKAELGSFFRKEGQRNFAKCPEQVLRKFIHGLGIAAS